MPPHHKIAPDKASKIEQSLRKSEERFKRVVEFAPTAMVMIGPSGTIEMVNVQAERLFGYSRSELLGKPIEILIPARYKNKHPKLRASFFQVLDSRPMGAGRDLFGLKKDGSEFPIEIGLNPIETEDGMMVLSAIADISERQQKSLEAGRLAAIVASSSEAIIGKTLDGVITSWNPAAERLFGYAADEVIGRNISLVIPTSRLDEEETILRRIKIGERLEQFETLRRHADGREILVSLTVSPIFGPDGKIIGASKIVRDITAEKRFQQQIIRERDTAQRYLDVAGVMILALDVKGNVTLINRRGCNLLGYDDPQAIVGKPWIDTFIPERMRDTTREAFDLLISGKTPGLEYNTNPVVTKTGEERIIAWHNSRLVDDNGRATATLSSGEDITERAKIENSLRLSEERFRSIFDAVAEGIIITDAETGTFTDVNGPGAAMYGYTPNEMIGLRIEAISSGVSPYTQDGAITWIEKAASSGETQQFDWHAKKKDGGLFWADISIRFAFIGGQKVVLAIARDVTDRREMEAQLRQALKMEAIGTLAGGVAHELNNLLQPIIMMTELVMTKLPDQGTEFHQLERVVDAGAKASEIVQRILAFGRSDEVSHRLLDISLVVREGISFIRTIMPTSVTLHVGIDEFVGLVRGDKTQLTQVLINLATNARDAIGARIGTLSVWLSKTDENFERIEPKTGMVTRGPCAVLAVGDTGSGMDSETALRIFEPFFTTKGVGKGTGLGLSVTHGIVTGHGGTIQVDSKPGAGTRFSIYLPLVEPNGATEAVSNQKGG